MASRRTRPVADRFHEKYQIVTETGCWIWFAQTSTAGYGYMYANGQQQCAHRLSWQIHFGPIPDGMLIRHRCDTKPCVNPHHLAIGDEKANAADYLARGGVKPFEARRVLTNDQILEIYADPRPIRDLARIYGVHRHTVAHIKSGECWGHVTGAKYQYRGDMKGERHPNAKLTDEQAAEIMSSSERAIDAAARYGVSKSAIFSIRSGRRRSHPIALSKEPKP